jgi:hypothetical protein
VQPAADGLDGGHLGGVGVQRLQVDEEGRDAFAQRLPDVAFSQVPEIVA